MKKLILSLLTLSLVQCTFSQDFADLVAYVDSSVVTIFVEAKVNPGQGNPYTQTSAESLGSGVLIGEKHKIVLTAAHVVGDAAKIDVELISGKRVSAKVIRISRTADVAIIELDESQADIPAAVLGNSDLVRTGDNIFIIGAPLGLSHSVSRGIISSKRSHKQSTNDHLSMEFFQTDASINKGNSGGPMFNMKGEVIGIVSSILSFSGGFEGLGFAASSNIAKEILSERGSVWFGIDALLMNEELCHLLNVPQSGAVLVQGVAEGSPAYYMGLKGGYYQMMLGELSCLIGGDIILAFDKVKFDSPECIEELYAYINDLEKYHKYKLTILRNGQIETINWQFTE